MNPIQRLMKPQTETLTEGTAVAAAVQFVVNSVGDSWKPGEIMTAVLAASKRYKVTTDELEKALENRIGIS